LFVGDANQKDSAIAVEEGGHSFHDQLFDRSTRPLQIRIPAKGALKLHGLAFIQIIRLFTRHSRPTPVPGVDSEEAGAQKPTYAAHNTVECGSLTQKAPLAAYVIE